MSENIFKDDFGVYVCPHVFKKETPILEVIRDPEGDWQFFCGGDHSGESEGPKLIGVGHLTNEDSSIHELTKMEPNSFAAREYVGGPWIFGIL
jgi:hypothetical protein